MNKELYLNVVMQDDVYEELRSEMLVDVVVADNGTYVVKKMVFFQTDRKTGKGAWVVFPKEHYEFRLNVMKDALEKEIKRVSADPKYNGEKYHNIIASTRKKMLLQE